MLFVQYLSLVPCIYIHFNFWLLVPAGPRTTFIGPQRRWKDDAVDDSYKGKLPSWLTEQKLSNKRGQFYEVLMLILLFVVYYCVWYLISDSQSFMDS